MELRGPRAGDVDRMFTLDVACFARPFRFPRAAMQRYVLEPGALVRLAVDQSGPGQQESLLGFGIVHVREADACLQGYLVTLDVDPACRRRGIARLLMDDLHQGAERAGAERMELHVHQANQAAVRLYETLGYRCEATARNLYGPGLHALVYGRSLRSVSHPGADAGPG